jgi:hypothetical protein
MILRPARQCLPGSGGENRGRARLSLDNFGPNHQLYVSLFEVETISPGKILDVLRVGSSSRKRRREAPFDWTSPATRAKVSASHHATAAWCGSGGCRKPGDGSPARKLMDPGPWPPDSTGPNVCGLPRQRFAPQDRRRDRRLDPCRTHRWQWCAPSTPRRRRSAPVRPHNGGGPDTVCCCESALSRIRSRCARTATGSTRRAARLSPAGTGANCGSSASPAWFLDVRNFVPIHRNARDGGMILRAWRFLTQRRFH